MAKFEAILEINLVKVDSLAEYIAYCKYNNRLEKNKGLKILKNIIKNNSNTLSEKLMP